MSTDRDVTRSVRSWLEDGATELPDRVLDAVLDQLPATPQRRATWWPARRFAAMNNAAKFGLAAAVVVIAALLGFNYLVAPNIGSPGIDDPTPTVSPTATPSPSPTPEAALPEAGPLAIGRHSMTLDGVRFSIDIRTDGWVSNGSFGIDKGDTDAVGSAGFIFWTHTAADNVYADPCSQTPLSPPPTRTSADLAAAVAAVPGTELVTGPSEVTVGGFPAHHVAITIPATGCAPDEFHLWYDEDTPGESRFATRVTSTIYTWIIDVNGTLVWIDGETYPGSGPDAAQEIQQIIDSIQFE